MSMLSNTHSMPVVPVLMQIIRLTNDYKGRIHYVYMLLYTAFEGNADVLV